MSMYTIPHEIATMIERGDSYELTDEKQYRFLDAWCYANKRTVFCGKNEDFYRFERARRIAHKLFDFNKRLRALSAKEDTTNTSKLTEAGSTAMTISDGEWSKPMTKSAITTALGLRSIHTLATFAKNHPLRNVGNRQLWSIRMDDLTEEQKKNLRKK